MFLAAAGPHLLNMCVGSVELYFTSCARRDVDQIEKTLAHTVHFSVCFLSLSLSHHYSGVDRKQSK